MPCLTFNICVDIYQDVNIDEDFFRNSFLLKFFRKRMGESVCELTYSVYVIPVGGIKSANKYILFL